jgi:hypothetical protein
MANVNGLFEDELDADGMPVISEFGKRFADVTKDAMVEAVRDQVDERIDDRHDELVETIDAYMEQEVLPTVAESVDDAVAELRKLMLLAVAQIGGSDKAREFVRKVAELARAGALSSATGAWAQGGPPDASSNRDSVRGGGVSTRKEDVEREEAAEIFNEAIADMSEDGKAMMMELCGDLEYSGDASKLRREIELVRNQQVPSPLTESYVKAIARTIRR